MKRVAFLFLCLGACTPLPSVVTPDNFIMPAPAGTVQEAVTSGDPLFTEEQRQTLRPLPYFTPRVQSPGILISEFDAARYPILDAQADVWRVRALSTEWQLARTERRDATYAHTLERRVDRLALVARRRQVLMWTFLGAGIAAGAGATAVIAR